MSVSGPWLELELVRFCQPLRADESHHGHDRRETSEPKARRLALEAD